MTILQRLRGILTTDPHLAGLCACGITYDVPATIADRLRVDWEGATVRDPVFRDAATRIAVTVDQAAVSWLWRFEDQSVLTANDRGVWAR